MQWFFINSWYGSGVTLQLNDQTNAAWTLTTGGYQLGFNNHNGGSYSNKMCISNTGNFTALGTISSGSGSYIYTGGLRLGGFDTNTLYNSGKTLGITCDNGYNIYGVEQMVLVVICQ